MDSDPNHFRNFIIIDDNDHQQKQKLGKSIIISYRIIKNYHSKNTLFLRVKTVL